MLIARTKILIPGILNEINFSAAIPLIALDPVTDGFTNLVVHDGHVLASSFLDQLEECASQPRFFLNQLFHGVFQPRGYAIGNVAKAVLT